MKELEFNVARIKPESPNDWVLFRPAGRFQAEFNIEENEGYLNLYAINQKVEGLREDIRHQFNIPYEPVSDTHFDKNILGGGYLSFTPQGIRKIKEPRYVSNIRDYGDIDMNDLYELPVRKGMLCIMNGVTGYGPLPKKVMEKFVEPLRNYFKSQNVEITECMNMILEGNNELYNPRWFELGYGIDENRKK